jgi:RNA polymerase sigma factor (sigma-70 family)
MTATLTTRAVQSAARLDPRNDSELLARFLTHHDQAAFATLVQRHGPLVYGVCRRSLGASADADDAFQATFLVLVKRAAAIPWRANLGPWLFGVARRVSAKARFRRDRRFALEKQVDAMPHPEITPAEPDDLSQVFDEELARLPDDMRRAVVLCELQGLSRREAAGQLRVSEGTLSSRLGRARKKLAAAFADRGVKLTVPVAVGVSTVLTTSTVRAACDPAGAVPAGVSFLVQEALKAMTISKLKLGAVLAAVAVGCSWAALASDPKPVAPPAAVKADPPKAEVPPADAPPKKGKMELSISLRKAQEPVATVNGQDIKREEFAEHLIRKYGAKEIELFVNKKVIEDAAAKANVSVTDEEVDAAVLKQLDQANLTRKQFAEQVLSARGLTETDWREDVIRPRLLAEKLVGKVTATEDEARNMYERKYGEKRRVQIVQWGKEVGKEKVSDMYERVRKEPLLFDQLCVRVNTPDKPEERTILFDKGTVVYASVAVKNEAFNLAEAGDVSRLIPLDQGWCAVKLVEVIPAVKGKKFEEEKTAFLTEAAREKLPFETAQRVQKLKDEAKPVYHIKPEPKAYTVPLPTKK